MDEPDGLPAIFVKTCNLGIALGWKQINRLPGCQHIQIDESWECYMNPHREPTECSAGTEVPPFTIYFKFNGWPAGLCDAGGGTLAAGRIANEDVLLAALDAAIERVGVVDG